MDKIPTPTPEDDLTFLGWGILGVIILSLGFIFFAPSVPSVQNIPYSQFLQEVNSGKVEEVTLSNQQIVGTYRQNAVPQNQRFKTIPVADPNLLPTLQRNGVTFEGAVESTGFGSGMVWPIVILSILGLGWLFSRRGSPEKGFMSFSKSGARLSMGPGENKTTFADVAGVDEAKQELEEVVEFLRNPKKFTRLGGKVPKGILLIGPPGTGKTLIARALAGEAGVPFFSIGGSAFVEMFVGVGSARVRDLFEQAKAQAPCIIFIDELDAIGKSRGSNPMLSNDEREQTLNQLLSEMDGFDPTENVIVIAATNRPDSLDHALLRPGRFDRQVLVDRPDRQGRLAVLRLHAQKVSLGETADLELLAAETMGFAGADLANLVNEAALLAARRDAPAVEMKDLNEALERLIAGLQKMGRVLNQQERVTVAYHEVGHAIVGSSVLGSDPLRKISIIPRGQQALGYTLQLPQEDRHLLTRTELFGQLATLLGGRAAEDLMFNGEVSTGAANDLAKVTEIAEQMVTQLGMSHDLGNVCYLREGRNFLEDGTERRKTSEATAQMIDRAIRNLVDEAYDQAMATLRQNHTLLEEMAQSLLTHECLEGSDLEQFLKQIKRRSLPADLAYS
ncbi:MAG: ATP-dependent zinc metalloprotease FtsH [Gloeobacterales cyanobacterium]